jgi:hypothetical protein
MKECSAKDCQQVATQVVEFRDGTPALEVCYDHSIEWRGYPVTTTPLEASPSRS